MLLLLRSPLLLLPLLLVLLLRPQRLSSLAPAASNAIVVHTYTDLKKLYFPEFHSRFRNFTFPTAAPLRRLNVIIEQHYRKNGAGVGSAVWEGASVLSHFLAGAGRELAFGMCGGGRINVLEVGAGQGLVSITAGLSLLSAPALCREALIVATDGDANVLAQTRNNILRNIATSSTSVNISARLMKWGDAHDMDAVRLQLDGNLPLLIVAADVVFEMKEETPRQNMSTATLHASPNMAMHAANHAFRALASTFSHLCKQNKQQCLILLAYKRRRARESSFFELMFSEGFLKRKLKQRFLRPRRLRGDFEIYAFAPRRSTMNLLDQGRKHLFEDTIIGKMKSTRSQDL